MTEQEVIKTFMHSLDETTLKGAAALNEAIKASSKFKSFKAVRTQFLNDLQSAKNWQTFLVEKCGIVLDNTDTGAISGNDAGGSKIKTSTDILPSKGKLQPYPTTSSVTVRGMTLYGIPPKDTLTEDQQYVVRGLISWWLNDALKLIEESYGLTFTEEGSTGSRLKMQFMDDDDENSDLLAYVSFDTDDKKIYEATTLCVNMANFKNMSTSDHHGTTGYGNLDRTLVHELVHGVMVSNINYAAALPGWLVEGGTAELIHGVDDERYDAIIDFVKDVSTVKKVLTTKSIEDYKPDEIYEGGYVFMRYFAKQAGTDTTFDYDTYRAKVSVDANNFAVNYFDTVTIYGGSDADTITNSGLKVSIFGGKGNDTIRNYSDTVTINGGGDDDSILNEGANVTIYGGSGKDSIHNEGANVSISGGSGNDSITNRGSNVTISGGKGNDSIENYGANVSINGGSNNDSITNTYDAKNSTVDGGSGNDSITNSGANSMIYGGTGKDSIENNYDAKNSTVDGGNGNDSIINHAEASSITGGAGNDSITNQGKSSSINGGTGNDVILNTGNVNSFASLSGSEATLRGGDGKDSITNHVANVKIYGDAGNDKIANYGASTWIQGGDGNDSILNDSTLLVGEGFNNVNLKGTNSTLRGGNGNDSITNTMDSVSVYGDDGNDYIHSKGDKLKLYGGNGDDFIYNYFNTPSKDDENPASENTVYGGAGNDTVISYADSSRINLGSGDDSIQNFADLTSIAGSSGNDYIYSSGEKVTLSGGSGNDYIYNEGYKVTIFGGSGNDTLHNEGNHVTLSGGKGNDSIINDGGAHITYNFGKSYGKDIVVGFNANDTVQITSGSYKSSKSGSNVLVKVGKSILTLVDAVGKKINFISSSGVEKTKTYTATAARWFNDDTNIATSNDLSSIVKSKSDVATTNLTTSLTSLTDSTSKTVQLTYGGKK